MTAPPPPSSESSAAESRRPNSWRNDTTGLLHDAYAQFRTFDRARSGRMVAGVCAGVGRRLGIDPVVIRVVIAVLALVSGAGLVLYGAAWLLLPEDGREQSIAERLFGRRGSEPNGAIVVGVGAIVALVAMSMLPWGEDWWGPVLIALILAGLIALARRRPDEASADPLAFLDAPGGSAAATAVPEPSAPAGQAESTQPEPGQPEPVRSVPAELEPDPPLTTETEPVGTHLAAILSAETQSIETESVPVETSTAEALTAGTATAETTPSPPTPEVRPRTWTQHAATPAAPSFWAQPDPLGLEETSGPEQLIALPPAPAKAVKRPRSLLFPVTLGIALLSVFVLAAATGAGGIVPLAFWAAVPLGVIGLGLLVGTRYGRSGGLIALGIPLALAVVPLSVADAVAPGGYWDDEAHYGDRSFAPDSVAEIQPSYEHGAGELMLDLSGVAFTDDDNVDVRIESGVGDLDVIAPDGVDVQVHGSVGLGSASIFGGDSDSPAPVIDTLDEGRDGPGGGLLTLDASLGLGDLEVSRDNPTPTADIPRPDPPPSPPRVEEPEGPR